MTSSSGELEAVYAPGVGMVCCSLRHRGEELLGQRGGLEAYATKGSTFGIPLLYPWANRLAAMNYSFEGVDVTLSADESPLHFDSAGLPMHGLLGASPYWEVVEAGESGGAALLQARLVQADVLQGRCSELQLSLQAQQLDLEQLARRLALLEQLVSTGSDASLRLQGRLTQALA